MKSILFSAVSVFAASAVSFAQAPQHPLAQVFGPRIAASLTFNDSTPVSTQILNATGEQPIISQNSWVEIHGNNLSQTTRIWGGGDFVNGELPQALDGVSATVNGKPAYIYYISPTQINVLSPPDTATGTVPVQVSTQFGSSAVTTVNMQAEAPGFFQFNGGPYVAAIHANGTLLAPASLYPGASTPAAPGETVVLYGNGFGPVNPPITTGSASQFGTLAVNPVFTIGNLPCQVIFAGLVSPGEFQFNIVVPTAAPNGDNALVATYNGFTTQPGVLITVQH